MSAKQNIATLPYETLHQIALLCLEEDRTRVFHLEHPFAPENTSPHPLIPLSQTCRSLRNVCNPLLFRVINISNRRGCRRTFTTMIEQLSKVLEFDKVVENIKLLRLYYVGNPENADVVIAPSEKVMIEDESQVVLLVVQLFQRLSVGLQKLRLIIEPPKADDMFKKAFATAGITLPKVRELRVGDLNDWMIRLCPAVEVVTQVQYNGNLPRGFDGRTWAKGSEDLIENIRSAKGLKMLWVWGSFGGKGLDDLVAAAPKLNHIGFCGGWAEPFLHLSHHLIPLSQTLEHLTFLLIDFKPFGREEFVRHFARILPKLKFIWFATSYSAEIIRSYSPAAGGDGQLVEMVDIVWQYSEDNQVAWRCGAFDELIIRRY